MTSNMRIELSQAQGRVPITIFHIKGVIDISSYEEFQAKAEEVYQAGARNLLLDFTDVEHLASAGLRAMHAIFTLLRTDATEEEDAKMKAGLADGSFKSQHLKLLNPSPNVFTVLKHAGYDMFLESYDDLEKAVTSF